MEGLLIALDNIDEVIRIIRNSANVQEAKEGLIAAFGLTEAQAQAIVDMRLRALTGLERSKIEAEYQELMATIRRLEEILADRNKLLIVIRDELAAIGEKYGDDRRTRITFEANEISKEDMIANEPTVITATQMGYIKRMTVDNFRIQNRGGKGIKGMKTIEDDSVVDVMMTKTHDNLLFFTNQGRVYLLKAYEIPEASRTARGTAIVNLLMLQPNEHVTTVIPLANLGDDSKYLFMATKNGMVKRTSLSAFANVRKNGLVAIILQEGDELIKVLYTEGREEVYLVSANGMSIRFPESDVRPMGRAAGGVRGMRLDEGDVCVSMQLGIQGSHMLCITEKGLGKRTPLAEFRIQSRGGRGIKCYNCNEKTGEVVDMKMVNEDSEVLLITTEGTIIRTPVSDINICGRIAMGVKCINLPEGTFVAGFTKVHPEALTKNEAADEAKETTTLDSANEAAGETTEAEDDVERTKTGETLVEKVENRDDSLERLLAAAEADAKEEDSEA